MTAYLDTHVALWFASGHTERISAEALKLARRSDLRLSPMVYLEMEYLYELGRAKVRARDLLIKLQHELHVELCEFPFADVASAAVEEKWTRDPFDRMIVAHAKVNGLAPLISADQAIATHYSRTVW